MHQIKQVRVPSGFIYMFQYRWITIVVSSSTRKSNHYILMMYVPNDMFPRYPNSAYLFFNTVLICMHNLDFKFRKLALSKLSWALTNTKLRRKLMVLYQNLVMIICIPPSGWASSETHSLTLSADGTPARSRPSTLHHPKHEISEITLKPWQTWGCIIIFVMTENIYFRKYLLL